MANIETLNDLTGDKPVIEHKGAVTKKGNFRHVMALTLDPTRNNHEGIIRCIKSRSGDVAISGYIDRSELHRISGNTLEHFQILNKITFDGETELITKLENDRWDCLGFEDPDIFVDPDTNEMHVYFTIPLKHKTRDKMNIYLGHAQGKDLDSLSITESVLSPTKNVPNGAKEVSIAPKNKYGYRLNLIESGENIGNTSYSVVRIAMSKNPGGAWEFGDIVFHPAYKSYNWCAGHVSPGPLLPRTFVDLGKDKMLGILNGRQASTKVKGKTKYGIFSPGLFIYNFEKGKIDWVSELPLIRDSQARTITFASHFVQIDKSMGILYAHVDDSFVRAYTLNAEAIKKLLP